MCGFISNLDYELPEGRDCVFLDIEPQHPALGLVLSMGSVHGSPPPTSVEETKGQVSSEAPMSAWLPTVNKCY